MATGFAHRGPVHTHSVLMLRGAIQRGMMQQLFQFPLYLEVTLDQANNLTGKEKGVASRHLS